MASQWNLFVKKIYEEGKAKNNNYSFKTALKDASRRKSEMRNMSVPLKTKSRRTKRTRQSKKTRRTY
jgi:hypothetical protein